MRSVLIVVVGSLVACSDAITDADLIGVYVATYRGDRATLVLNADYTYRHVIHARDGQGLEGSSTYATYRLDNASRTTRVEFVNFRVVPAYIDERREIVGWSTPVEKTWLGRYRLCFDSDVGYCYMKQ